MKDKIRKSILNKRKSLSLKEINNMSKKMTQNFLDTNFNFKDKFIHTYTKPLDGEPLTNFLIDAIQNDAKDIITSKTLFKERKLIHYSLLDEEIYEGSLDYIIVPGVAFTDQGDRIGYGYGFYDRFLEKHPHSSKIAFAYEFQIHHLFQSEIHDIKMDYICTEKQIYKMI